MSPTSTTRQSNDYGLGLADPNMGQAGFVICAAGTPRLRVLYADANARRVFAGRRLIGDDLASLFDLSEATGSLHRDVATGRTRHFHFPLVGARRDIRRASVRLQPLVGSDGHEPWALCSFEGDPPDATPMPSGSIRMQDRSDPGAPTALELCAFTRDLARGLGSLLPGDVEVGMVLPVSPVWVDAPADALEEIVACLLALAAPLDPWRYAVRLGVQTDRNAGVAKLCFALAGGAGSTMATSPLPTGIAERMKSLGIHLVSDISSGIGHGLALVTALAPGPADPVDGGTRRS